MVFFKSLVSCFKISFGKTKLTFHCARIAYIYTKETIELLNKYDLLEAYCDHFSHEENYDDSPLHFLIKHNKNVSEETILEFISIVDMSLLLRTNKSHKTALHYAFEYNANINIINALIAKGGGKEYTLIADEYGQTALHLGVTSELNIDSIAALIDVGGKDLLQKSNDYLFYRETPLQSILRRQLFEYDFDFHSTRLRESFHMRSSNLDNGTIDMLCILLKYGIEFQIGGEFGCGGLFQTMIQNGSQASLLNEILDEDHWRLLLLPIFTKLSR